MGFKYTFEVLQATCYSNPRSISTEVSITTLNPKIFCFRLGFWGSRRTPMRASMPAGNLGHLKKKESFEMLSPITAPVMTPLLTMRSRRALRNSSTSSKIQLKILGCSGSASFKKRHKTSILGRGLSSGKLAYDLQLGLKE